MLEESRVVSSRRQDDSYATVSADAVHHLPQQVGIVAVVGNGEALECFWRHLALDVSGYHRV